ncbi:MAG TPA: DUF1565 domain-containing protein, partial [Polyangiaceae bacterium]
MRILHLNAGRLTWLVAGAGAAVLSFTACSDEFSGCGADKDCGAAAGAAGSAGASGSAGAAGSAGTGGSSGVGGSAGVGGSGAGTGGAAGESGAAGADGGTPCDTTQSPTSESCLIDDAYGIFVAPSGDDAGDGTMSNPVKTITKALTLAKTDAKFVIACDGSYDERLNITEGAQLYGGFKCPGGTGAWTRETSGKATVAPAMRGVALNINATSKTAPVSIDNFEFDAQDGVDPGESSIAAFVNTPSTVALTNVKLVAGKGVNGADGTVTDLMFPAQTDLNGNAASGDTGGGGKVCTCADGATSKGGKGGDGGAVNATGGGAGSPALAGGA